MRRLVWLAVVVAVLFALATARLSKGERMLFSSSDTSVVVHGR